MQRKPLTKFNTHLWLKLSRKRESFFQLPGSKVILSHFSRVRLFATSWTVAHQPPLSMRFSRQEYWSGLPCPSLGDLPDPGIENTSPVSPALQADSLPLSHLGSLEVRPEHTFGPCLSSSLGKPTSKVTEVGRILAPMTFTLWCHNLNYFALHDKREFVDILKAINQLPLK